MTDSGEIGMDDHAVSITTTHGPDCARCEAVKAIAFRAIAGQTKRSENQPSLAEKFAEDIAVWARVYGGDGWTKDKPAVRNLAQRLARVAGDSGRKQPEE